MKINRLIYQVILFAVVSVNLSAADWPKFLGPRGDGISEETSWNQNWQGKEPPVLWDADVGIGCASVTIAQGRAYTVGQLAKGQDTIFCFDAVTGKKQWEFSYPQDLEPTYYSGGPSCAPTIDGGKLYTVSKVGDLICLDAVTGSLIWKKNYITDFGGEKQMWGYAAAPLPVGDMIICEPGGTAGSSIVALKKNTGEVAWKSGNDKAGYTTPVLFANDAHTGFVCFNEFGLVGHALTGGELFRHPWKTQYGVNAANPLHKDGQFLISSDYGAGASLIKTTAEGVVSVVWKNEALLLQFQNMVLVGDHVYAVSGDNRTRADLKCVEFATGKVKWSERLRENRGNVLVAANKLLVLSESGELLLVEPDPSAFKPLGKVQANRKPCWAPPAFSNGLLYTRNNDGKLTCMDLR